ncbi:hypothetical protein ACNFU2_19300 [Chryseobacterium sp. PTM-20240506]|uniref:hypothetical protein n=1 Tax=unclassified Chryseobacterium TaxID=2593645 RepID=UPI001555439E|nr:MULTISPECIES: hypothetical protein [unclassified Chryseobacterium]MDQ1802404.1 hypothetical protein [Chryseobacterium sp. CKR4-1]
MKLLKENIHYLLFLSAVFFLWNPAKFPVDDGYFYPQIAYNMVRNGFMGFNDLYLTNGFHPLWMVFCVIAEAINFLGKSFSVYILWFFQVIFIIAGYRFFEKTLFKDSVSGKVLSLALYCLIFFSLGSLYLTEAHLTFFTIAWLLYFLCKRYTNDFLFGFICSLVFLARLDHIFIIIPLGFLYWKHRDWNFQSISKVILGFLILAGPYLFSNQYLFGDMVPVSGRIKSSFPKANLDDPFGLLPDLFLFVGSAYLIFLIFTKNIHYRSVKILFISGSFIHLLYNVFFQSYTGQWYFVSQFIFCGFFINDIVEKFQLRIVPARSKFIIYSLGSTFFLCTIGILKLKTNLSIFHNVFDNKSKFEKKTKDMVKNLAEDLVNVVPRKSRIYVYDFPGKFAFYSDFNFIPADALVANSTFFNEINTLRFKDYLKKNKINYMLFPSQLEKGRNSITFMGMDVKKKNNRNMFYFRNTLSKKIIDSLDENELIKVKTYLNPAKTWQAQYDSVTIYKLKEK